VHFQRAKRKYKYGYYDDEGAKMKDMKRRIR